MKTAFLFPGQGSQSVGMGKTFYDSYALVRETFEEANETLKFNLKELMFEGPLEGLTLTKNTQPALVTVSIALLRVLQKESGKTLTELCQAVAGHSLGEYAALCAAHVITFEETLRLVRLRGQAMQESVPEGEGAMAAILGLSFQQVEAALSQIEDCDVANDNAPTQVVISGKKDAVQQAIVKCQEVGAKRGILLPVSAPFHSRFMTHAADVMKDALEPVSFKMPSVPVYTNVTADAQTLPQTLKDNLVTQICGRVRWVETIQSMTSQGFETFIEIGSGKVLTGLNRQIAPDTKSYTLNTPEDLESILS
jgi:[acyl-carrier-protein] S-malonyltransferase